jgi:UDP-N-acetylglucosamine--N-acetylmuramyl-(pentapeptide) pyrophosphoryl-undecaprenol N-acetylglucosamine transferase
MNKIILTGGGSAGHVVPNVALITKLHQENWDVFYIGSKNGIEREIISKQNIPYFSISTGKLRRYFSWHNFIDPFKIIYGVLQAFILCHKIKPNIIFSKGGFVSFPVVIAAWLNRIPVIIHESDLTPGLANKLSFPFSEQICVTFEDTQKYINKAIVTGTPLREELFLGDKNKGLDLCNFVSDKKVILIYAGGSGSKKINKVVRALLPKLLIDFQVIHICGKNNLAANLNLTGYKQFEYLYDELADMFACANIVISRAGANSIYELLMLRKPHILIPLPKTASRGDQIANAKHFAKLGLSQIIFEEILTEDELYKKILLVKKQAEQITKTLANYKKQDSVQLIYDIICQNINN